jgi:hypothetical protein
MYDENDDRTPKPYREHSVYGTDFSKPLDVLIEEIRSQLVRLRGQLADIEMGYVGIGWRMKTAEEGLTLVISYLYDFTEGGKP